MRNLAQIVKDETNNLYLKVYDDKIKLIGFFQIQECDTKPIGEIEDLTDCFSIDLNPIKED